MEPYARPVHHGADAKVRSQQQGQRLQRDQPNPASTTGCISGLLQPLCVAHVSSLSVHAKVDDAAAASIPDAPAAASLPNGPATTGLPNGPPARSLPNGSASSSNVP